METSMRMLPLEAHIFKRQQDRHKRRCAWWNRVSLVATISLCGETIV